MSTDLLFGIKIKIIDTLIKKEFHKIIKHFDITPAQADILHFLDTNRDIQVSQRSIEHYLNLSNPTIAGTLKRIESKGLILSTPNVLDRRSNDISLTEKAEKIIRDIHQQILKMEQRVLLGFSEDEISQIHTLLSKIINNFKEETHD